MEGRKRKPERTRKRTPKPTPTPVLRLRLVSRGPGRWASKRNLFGVVVWVCADNIGLKGVEEARLSVIAPESTRMRVQNRGWSTERSPEETSNAEPAAILDGQEVESHANESWVDLPPATSSGIAGPRVDTRVLFIFSEPGQYTVHAKLDHDLADPALKSIEVEVPERTDGGPFMEPAPEDEEEEESGPPPELPPPPIYDAEAEPPAPMAPPEQPAEEPQPTPEELQPVSREELAAAQEAHDEDAYDEDAYDEEAHDEEARDDEAAGAAAEEKAAVLTELMADTTKPRRRFFRRERKPKPPKPPKPPKSPKPPKPEKVKEPKPSKSAPPPKPKTATQPRAPRKPLPAGTPHWMPLALAGLALLIAVGALIRAGGAGNDAPPSVVNISGRQSELRGVVKPPLMVCDAPFHTKWRAGPANEVPSYSRDPFGIVRLDGQAVCQTRGEPRSSATPIFTLPRGYRPSRAQYQVVRASGTSPFADSVVIGAEGLVRPEAAATVLYLGGISFRCAPSGENGCP